MSIDDMVDLTLLNNFTLFENVSTCDYVNQTFHALLDMRDIANENENLAGIIVSAFVILLSLVSLIYGARLFRPVSAITASLFTFYGIYTITENNTGITCDARIIISSCISLISALMIGCFIKLALFIIGAFSFGMFVHLIFSSFPELHTIGDVPIILEKSILYWSSLLLAGIIGGLLLRWNEKPSLEIMTSIIGGAGLSYGLHGLTESSGVNINHIVFFISTIVFSIIGTIIQRKLRFKKKKKNNDDKKERV